MWRTPYFVAYSKLHMENASYCNNILKEKPASNINIIEMLLTLCVSNIFINVVVPKLQNNLHCVTAG